MRSAQGCFAVFTCTARLASAVLCFFIIPSSTLVFGQGSDSSAKFSELHQRIDQLLIDANNPSLAAARATDGQLLRRLSLDLRGVVPTRLELDAFVADSSEERWQHWISRFLADPLCDEHLVAFLDRTLMLRRPHTLVDRAAWLNYLREQVANDTPLDQFSQNILYTPWWNQEHRASQRFYLDRGGDPNLIARDLGRVFLGQDLQCAQCHDHPLVDDYKQTDYHGLVAFFAPSKFVEASYKDAEGKDQKTQLYVEMPAGDAAFESVFNKGFPFRSGPRLPGGVEQFEDYEMPDDRLRTDPPADALAGIPLPPKHSRRQRLAEQLASRDNRHFVSNWANRLWAQVFGEGLVHPVDMQHADNPPSHPAVYALVTDGLIELQMQPRRFLEQLVLTQAYQRGGFSPIEESGPEEFPSSLAAEQVAAITQSVERQLASSTASVEELRAKESTAYDVYEAASEVWSDIQAGRAAVRTELDAAEAEMLGEKKKSTDAAVAVGAAEKRKSDVDMRITLLDEAATKLQQALELSGGEDAELKQAIDLSKQRSEAGKAALPEVDKAVADTKAALDAITITLKQATAKVNAVVEKLKPIQQALLAADLALLDARTHWNQANVAMLDAKQQREHAEHQLAWLASLNTSESIQAEISLVEQAIAATEAKVAEVNQVVLAVESQLALSTKIHTANGEVVSAAQAVIQRRLNEMTQLQQSIDALEQTAGLVPAAETLIAAKDAIRSELERRSTQTGELQSELSEAQMNFEASQTKVVQDQKELEAKQVEAALFNEQLTQARQQMTGKQAELASARTQSVEHWATVDAERARQLEKTRLFALTPEQLCWSILRITGQLDAYINIELTEIEKQSPLAEDADETAKAIRQRQAVRAALDKLRGNADVFVSLYASGPDKTQDDFFASADQALYTANSGTVFAWAGPGNNNVTQQAIAMTDEHEIAHSLYWTLLCRQPTEAEEILIAEQLATAGDARNTVIQEMVWGILVSAEFRFCR